MHVLVVLLFVTSCHFVFFILLIRRPRRSTLFSYTTLFRSSAAFRCSSCRTSRASWSAASTRQAASRATAPKWRSEEHTSELQSLRHLVCRLLLEKKKKLQGPSGTIKIG